MVFWAQMDQDVRSDTQLLILTSATNPLSQALWYSVSIDHLYTAPALHRRAGGGARGAASGGIRIPGSQCLLGSLG